MAVSSIATTGANDELERSRRHLIYRLAFGVGGCMVVADGLDWALPFLGPLIAATLIAAMPRAPRLAQGAVLFVTMCVAVFLRRAVCDLLKDMPLALIAIVSLILYLSFYAHWRGAPGIVTLLVQLATISIPIYSIISPLASLAISELLWQATLVAVLLVWISFAAFPAPIIPLRPHRRPRPRRRGLRRIIAAARYSMRGLRASVPPSIS